MSPNQGPKALLEGSNNNSDYQTVSKLDKLIVQSSGSMRRIQRAQERRIPTSLSQKIIHRTDHDQGDRYRPSIQTTPEIPLISPLFTSHATQPSFSLKRDPRQEEKKRREEEKRRRRLLHDHRRSSAGPPPDAGVPPDRHLTSEFCRTATRCRSSAGFPPLDAGVTTDCQLKLDFSL
ncbi:hypothetical protein M5K25_013150 [Dendrobium thyrsiflorum]|uniref:Uncharacterized protein n=1 Tax=Dendrobium thyrsiflorum TaxID=117978 RepID=A0ABD0UZ96_DENTH